MDYSLARELKDAGFPNIRIGDYFEHTMGSHSDTTDSEPCYCNQDRFPNLEELVEACGARLHCLRRLADDHWEAQAGPFDFGVRGFKTPLETVARLWLALRSK